MKKTIFVCLLFSFIALYGCGQTGPLYLPAADQHSDQSSTTKKS